VPSAKLRPEPRGHPGAADQQRSAGKCQADHPTPYGRRQATACRTSLISCLRRHAFCAWSQRETAFLVPVWQSGSGP
jgi:hypothetical protein